MKQKLAALVALILPPFFLKNYILSLLGWRIKGRVRIGFSYIEVKSVSLAEGVVIGHANFIKNDLLVMEEFAYIQHVNRLSGPFACVLKKKAGIGVFNVIKRAKKPLVWGRSMLKLGYLSKITSHHVVDCCRSVRMGDYSILAGRGSQLWTHGYLHAPTGAGRFRLDGRITIGNNVYIGSASVINPGVKIGDKITLGAHSSIATSLLQPGLYVSQALRYIPLDYMAVKARYSEVQVPDLVETVVNKKLPH
ncbi:MAG: hypothetical protein Q9N68_09090 [Gammaproteobacteria bacterium]|nr:hypothetical protein [Gammaproteobacteria bacterium]